MSAVRVPRVHVVGVGKASFIEQDDFEDFAHVGGIGVGGGVVAGVQGVGGGVVEGRGAGIVGVSELVGVGGCDCGDGGLPVEEDVDEVGGVVGGGVVGRVEW